MMNKLYLSLLLLPCIVTLSAQNSYQKATETQKKEITDNIRRVAREIKTLKADFTQVKELSFMKDQVTSEGKMLYKPNDKIRWEYTRPYAYVFAMDGDNVRISFSWTFSVSRTDSDRLEQTLLDSNNCSDPSSPLKMVPSAPHSDRRAHV